MANIFIITIISVPAPTKQMTATPAKEENNPNPLAITHNGSSRGGGCDR